MLYNLSGDEARALSVNVAIACAVLAVRIEALRHHEVELIFGSCHGDI
jgi:hypothetical protein